MGGLAACAGCLAGWLAGCSPVCLACQAAHQPGGATTSQPELAFALPGCEIDVARRALGVSIAPWSPAWLDIGQPAKQHALTSTWSIHSLPQPKVLQISSCPRDFREKRCSV